MSLYLFTSYSGSRGEAPGRFFWDFRRSHYRFLLWLVPATLGRRQSARGVWVRQG